jgi:hypothetical protein
MTLTLALVPVLGFATGFAVALALVPTLTPQTIPLLLDRAYHTRLRGL